MVRGRRLYLDLDQQADLLIVGNNCIFPDASLTRPFISCLQPPACEHKPSLDQDE